MKERLYIGLFAFGVIITAAVGVFSLVMELRIPSGYERAAEEYYDIELLSEFSGTLRDFRREGMNYLILLQESHQTRFSQVDRTLQELMQRIREERTELGDPAAVDLILAETGDYVREFRQIVSTAESLETEEVLQQIRELIEKGQVDRILDRIMELDKQNYLDYVRFSNRVSKAAKKTLLAITLFEVAALGLIIFSGRMLLRSYHRNKALLAQAEGLKARLEEKNRELESFVRVVGHDLRAPLINIKGFSEEITENHRQLEALIRSLSPPPETAEGIDQILERDVPEAIHFIGASVDTLNRLIQSMVTVAKAGQLPLHPVVIDADQLVKEILQDFDFRIQEAGVRVQTDSLPKCVGDAGQVRQVFSNLIDNAIKYREPSRPLELRIYGFTSGQQCVYYFEDNGIGIAPEEIDHIFNLYHQIRRKEMTGEGIGLATVKRMVEHNGGSVGVESELDKGSRFIVYLPVAKGS